MPAKRNQMIPDAHFQKDWDTYQPTHQRCCKAHGLKAAKVAPMPVKSLRPIVRFPNFKSNKDRGFSLEELKGAGLTNNMTKTTCISVDDCRKNKSLESLQHNVQGLIANPRLFLYFVKEMSKFRRTLSN